MDRNYIRELAEDLLDAVYDSAENYTEYDLSSKKDEDMKILIHKEVLCKAGIDPESELVEVTYGDGRITITTVRPRVKIPDELANFFEHMGIPRTSAERLLAAEMK